MLVSVRVAALVDESVVDVDDSAVRAEGVALGNTVDDGIDPIVVVGGAAAVSPVVEGACGVVAIVAGAVVVAIVAGAVAVVVAVVVVVVVVVAVVVARAGQAVDSDVMFFKTLYTAASSLNCPPVSTAPTGSLKVVLLNKGL
jgi:hypothetical protein